MYFLCMIGAIRVLLEQTGNRGGRWSAGVGSASEPRFAAPGPQLSLDTSQSF